MSQVSKALRTSASRQDVGPGRVPLPKVSPQLPVRARTPAHPQPCPSPAHPQPSPRLVPSPGGVPSHPLSPSQPCWPPGAGHRWGPHHPATGAASLCIPLGSCPRAGTVTWIVAAHTPTRAQQQIATIGEVRPWCTPYILYPLCMDPRSCSLLPPVLYGSLELAPLSLLPWCLQQHCGVQPARPVVPTARESVFVAKFPPP